MKTTPNPLPDALLKAVSTVAAEQGMTPSLWIRNALGLALGHAESTSPGLARIARERNGRLDVLVSNAGDQLAKLRIKIERSIATKTLTKEEDANYRKQVRAAALVSMGVSGLSDDDLAKTKLVFESASAWEVTPAHVDALIDLQKRYRERTPS